MPTCAPSSLYMGCFPDLDSVYGIIGIDPKTGGGRPSNFSDLLNLKLE